MQLTERADLVSFRPLRLLVLVASVAAAAALIFSSVSAHIERACTTLDTPYLPLCAEEAMEPELRRAELKERIRANPGDANAWTRLLAVTSPADAQGTLAAAAEIAPNHPNVLRRRAGAALEQNRLPEAAELLVQMMETRGTPEAGHVLAQIIGAGQGAVLRTHLASADRWLPGVVNRFMPSQKIPPSLAVPLVAEAVTMGTLSDNALTGFLQLLKGAGQWHDAYGLWLLQHKGTMPLLYNGDFDRRLEAGGFDWESDQGMRTRAGALVEQGRFPKRGRVLEVSFNGKSFVVPIVRQYLVVPPGTYRLHGEFKASKLKTEGGLVWKVTCPSARNASAGESAALKGTGGVWKTFEFVFTITPACGPVASLQLEAAAGLEASAGMRGEFAFDAFTLTVGTGKP